MQKPDLVALLAATDTAPYDLAQHQLAGYAPQLEPELKPCVYLLAGEAGEEAPLGSRVGGAPALPAGATWPATEDGAPLAFLLQVNLSEVPAPESSPLPDAGLLSFFAAQGTGAANVPCRVFYFSPEQLAALEPHAPPYTSNPADEDLQDIQAYALKPRLGWTLPNVMLGEGTELVERLLGDSMDGDLENALYSALAELGHELKPSGTVARLLGHVPAIDSDPREDAFAVRELGEENLYDYAEQSKPDTTQARRWQHLLTLCSSHQLGLCIWDAGFLSFLVEESELAAQDFSCVYACVQSS